MIRLPAMLVSPTGWFKRPIVRAAHGKIRQLIDQNQQLMGKTDNSADWTTPGPVLENGNSDQGGAS